ncbi:MAG: hypothetical protein E6325_25930, partial [Enterobacteriaceae bacterium]|nr:hypothetical protein [Enterobacteriaceae bacterium]
HKAGFCFWFPLLLQAENRCEGEHSAPSFPDAAAPYPGYPPLTLKTRQTLHSRTINHIKIMPLEKYFLT